MLHIVGCGKVRETTLFILSKTILIGLLMKCDVTSGLPFANVWSDICMRVNGKFSHIISLHENGVAYVNKRRSMENLNLDGAVGVFLCSRRV